jgi:hypothetical protein
MRKGIGLMDQESTIGLHGSLDQQRSKLLLYVLCVLYLCSLAGGQPIGQSLIALVPDFALLIAIRYTLFRRRLRLGKALVGIGILIDWGFTAFFLLHPAFTLFDQVLAVIQSVTWALFGWFSFRMEPFEDQRTVTQESSSQLSDR